MSLISRRCSVLTEPSSSSPWFKSLLQNCKTLRHLEQLHAHFIRKGLDQDYFLLTDIISLSNSLSPDIISYAAVIFDSARQPNIYLWNTLIKGYCRNASLSASLSFFVRMMRSSNVVPDRYTFAPLVKACSGVLALREGQSIHGLIVRYGIDTDLFVGSSLVDFYGKCREIGRARKVFDEMLERNEVSWTSMIVGYMNVGDCLEAKRLFYEMPKRNSATWNAMISGFLRCGDLKTAKILFDEMPDKNVISITTMIDGFAKAGDVAYARYLFDQLPDKDIVSWSALMSGYVQNGLAHEAVSLFNNMRCRNVKPDDFILVSLMLACSQIGSLELAKWIDSYVNEMSIKPHQAHVAAALVDMNAKCGNMERATVLFEDMPKRDIISYCSMIHGLSIHGEGVQAVALFNRMLNEGLRPDKVSFTVILAACSRSGLVEEGCYYFDSMINDYSLVPSPDQYGCIIDLLGRSGKLKAAYELIKNMPVEPHAAAWGALLGACKLHCDIELGDEVARRLFEIEPQNAGNYVQLSNIYAAADRWLDVSQVRNQMRERGIRKIIGCSWI